MPQKGKSASKGSKTTRRRGPQRPRGPAITAPQVYREPKTAAELGIVCAACGAPAVWFDHGRAHAAKDHSAGFVCDNEPAIGRREKLLIKEQPSAP